MGWSYIIYTLAVFTIGAICGMVFTVRVER